MKVGTTGMWVRLHWRRQAATRRLRRPPTAAWHIVRQLGGYLLPADNPEYRWRIGGALALLVAAKGLNVAVGAAAQPRHST